MKFLGQEFQKLEHEQTETENDATEALPRGITIHHHQQSPQLVKATL